jgi:hypothetical protein
VLVLPDPPSLEELREQARARRRQRGVPLGVAEHELARDYGFASWPDLARRFSESPSTASSGRWSSGIPPRCPPCYPRC